jgi:hypothetical protein
LDKTLGIYQRNIGHITPHTFGCRFCAQKKFGDPQVKRTPSNHGISFQYGSTRIHQKMLLFMVATGDDSMTSTSSKLIVIPWKHFQNSSQNPEKSDKNPKTSIFSNKKRKMPSQGDPLRGPPCFGLSQHPADAPSQATPARSCHLLSLWPSHGPYGIIIHVSPDGNVAELSLFLLMMNFRVLLMVSHFWMIKN